MNTINPVYAVSHEIRGAKYLTIILSQIFYALVFVVGKIFGTSYENVALIGIGIIALFAAYEIISWDSQRTISYVNQANGMLSVVGGTLYGLCLEGARFPMEIPLLVATHSNFTWIVIVVTTMIACVLATINLCYFEKKYDEDILIELCEKTIVSMGVCYVQAATTVLVYLHLF